MLKILNEVLSLNAQESVVMANATIFRAFLNEVLSLNAQESRDDETRVIRLTSSMKS